MQSFGQSSAMIVEWVAAGAASTNTIATAAMMAMRRLLQFLLIVFGLSFVAEMAQQTPEAPTWHFVCMTRGVPIGQ